MYNTKANRKKLVDALRSGDYKQGAGNLTFRMPGDPETEYNCCLGVACQLFVKEYPDKLTVNKPAFVNDIRNPTMYVTEVPGGTVHCATFLPDIVRQWLGFKTESGNFWHDEENGLTSLATLNDDGTPFSKIADIIEAEPRGLCS